MSTSDVQTPAEESPRFARPSGFVPVAVDTLIASRIYDFHLFIRRDKGGSFVLYRSRGYPFAQDDLNKLTERGIRTLYIAFEDRDAYTESLNNLLLEGEQLTANQKYNLLKGAARSLFDEAMTES